MLGDSGYALRPWLHTPLSLEAVINHSAEEKYNNAHKAARTIIKQVNGVLKMRFRCCLKHRVLHYHPEIATKIINTCCILHNMCIDHNIPTPSPQLQADDLLEGLHVNTELNREYSAIQRINPLLTEGRAFQRSIILNYF